MEYVYAAMLLHKAGKPIDEENITKVLQSAGIEPDLFRVKALVAAISEVNIEEAIKSAPTVIMPSDTISEVKPTSASIETKELKEEKKGEKDEDEALEGLGALFG